MFDDEDLFEEMPAGMAATAPMVPVVSAVPPNMADGQGNLLSHVTVPIHNPTDDSVKMYTFPGTTSLPASVFQGGALTNYISSSDGLNGATGAFALVQNPRTGTHYAVADMCVEGGAGGCTSPLVLAGNFSRGTGGPAIPSVLTPKTCLPQYGGNPYGTNCSLAFH